MTAALIHISRLTRWGGGKLQATAHTINRGTLAEQARVSPPRHVSSRGAIGRHGMCLTVSKRGAPPQHDKGVFEVVLPCPDLRQREDIHRHFPASEAPLGVKFLVFDKTPRHHGHAAGVKSTPSSGSNGGMWSTGLVGKRGVGGIKAKGGADDSTSSKPGAKLGACLPVRGSSPLLAGKTQEHD